MPLRDDFATCPRCAGALNPDGKRLVCQAGCGVLVTEAELCTLIASMYAEPPASPIELVYKPPTQEEPVRTCPSCTTEMAKGSLYELQVDRCGEHGVWFDKEELGRVLAAAGTEHGSSIPLAQKITGGVMTATLIGLYLARILWFW